SLPFAGHRGPFFQGNRRHGRLHRTSSPLAHARGPRQAAEEDGQQTVTTTDILMDCRRAQDWLLQADEPGSERDMPAALREPRRSCAVCRVLIAKMRRLEEAWNALPALSNAEPAKQAFLRRLPGYTAKRGARAAPRQLVILHFARSRWAMAALLF